jgi:lipopolysaccharide biosynthesis glycosyltransferase
MVNNQNKINICFSIDNKYVKQCATVIASILSKSDSPFHFFILNLDIGIENKKIFENIKNIKDFEITFVDINCNDFDGCYIPPNSHFSIANYFRLKVSTLLSNLNKVIYLDSDIIVNRNLKELWDIPFDGSYILACKSMTYERNCLRLKLPEGTPYINSGVIVFDLEKIRRDKIEDKFFDCIMENPEIMQNVDQDVINIVLFKFKNGIKQLKQNWNVEVRTDELFKKEYIQFVNNPYIIHYLTKDKPWNPGSKQIYKNIFLKFYKVVETFFSKKDLVNNGKENESRYFYYLNNVFLKIKHINILKYKFFFLKLKSSGIFYLIRLFEKGVFILWDKLDKDKKRRKTDEDIMKKYFDGEYYVRKGIFKGMNYIKNATCSALLPKIYGSYEEPIQDWIFDIISKKYDNIIDVGCAEGYYAVGLALYSPSSTIYAYDTNKKAIKLCKELARINGVESRMRFSSLCTEKDLTYFSSKNSVIICDIEGGEKELLNPVLIPDLKNVDIIVEAHDFIVDGISEILIDRFRETHNIEVVFDYEKTIDFIPKKDIDQDALREIVDERRPFGMCWIRFLSKKN